MDIEALRRTYIAKLNAKTRLGHSLWQIRERAIASGLVLLDQEGIAREVAERRGGVKWNTAT